MKTNYFKVSILLFGLIAAFTSCDKIPEDDYLVELGEVDWAGKYVILEDYTGHKCPNCPNAAILADELKEIYKNKLIVIGVHAPDGPLTRPTTSYPQDFRTPEGNMWASTLDISGLPKGMVNRVNQGATWELQTGGWNDAIAKEMRVTPMLNLGATLIYNEATRAVTIKGIAKFLMPIRINMRIGTMLLQDSIIGSQTMPSGVTPTDNTNYVFNHVLRKTFDGTWGKSFVKATDGYRTGDSLAYNLTFTLEDAYTGISVVPEHCHIVVYVTTDEPSKTESLYQILQATEVSLMPKDKK